MGIPLEEHLPWCRCNRSDCRSRGVTSAYRRHPARSIRHTLSRIDPTPTSVIDSPARPHSDSCTCQRPACQLRRMASSNRRPSARPISHTPSRINPPLTSSIDHPLRSHPVIPSATPIPTLSIPTSRLPLNDTIGTSLNGQPSFSRSPMLPDSRSEQQNPHVQSGNNNSNAEGHLERMMGTHGNSSRPTGSPELDRIDITRRNMRSHIRRLRSGLRHNGDRPRRASEEERMERLDQAMREVENSLVPTDPHTRQQERRTPSVRQEQSEYSGPRGILNEPHTPIRASTTSLLLEHSNMHVSPARRRQASQQTRYFSYSFGRFDRPLDEGGFHQSIVSQENSTNNHPRTRRQEVPQRLSAEQVQLDYFRLSPPGPSPELTNNFYAADQNSISPLQLPSRTGIEQFTVRQHAMNNGSRTVQARPPGRVRM